MNYIRVMFNDVSGAGNFKLKINEVNVANHWDKNGKTSEEMGGFNFTTKEYIVRWLIRGNTLYDVEIPRDAEVVDVGNGVYRSNKIILRNPRLVTDDMALEFYKSSKLEEIRYYKAMAGAAIMGYRKTMLAILKDKVNKDNIDLVLSEVDDFVKPENATASKYVGKHNVYQEMIMLLDDIKNK